MIDGPGLERILAVIDDRNAADPRSLTIGGVTGPRELVAGRRACEWLLRLDPGAGPVQLVAARGHHLERWTFPRDAFPEGRGGYLRWRTEAKKAHAAEVGRIMRAEGASEEEADAAGRIIRKEGLGQDGAAQAHEDALCLVFLESQFDATTELVGDEKMVTVLARTLRKMSPEAIGLARTVPMSDTSKVLLGRAVESV